jgi:hypothetical protein
MAFTRGLFYPWIDITNEAWLKTTALYWDVIQTIVPQGLRDPYRNDTARALYDAQVLEPLVIGSRMRDVEALSDTVQRYLESPEGIAVLSGDPIDGFEFLHLDKLYGTLPDVVRLHPDKLPQMTRDILRAASRELDDGFIPVDRRFAQFYMTVLATRLSDQHGLGLLTDTSILDRLAIAAKLDAHVTVRPQWSRRRYSARDENPTIPRALAQGVLATLVLERLEIDPATPIRKILAFCENHYDELGRFRTKVGELTASVTADLPMSQMRQNAEDLYKNEVKPALRELKRALRGNKVKYVAEHSLKVTCFSFGATSIPLSLLGMAAPVALLAGVGVSLAAGLVYHNVEKAKQLSENAYTYLLSAESALK